MTAQQLDLEGFARTHARASDPDTSHAAARRVARAGTARRHVDLIAAALRHLGPSTASELAAATGLDMVAVNRRMADLRRSGLAVPTDDRRANPAGNAERVWTRAGEES